MRTETSAAPIWRCRTGLSQKSAARASVRAAAMTMVAAAAASVTFGPAARGAALTWDGTAAGDYRSPHWSNVATNPGDVLTLNAGSITSARTSPGGAVVLSGISADGQSLSIGGTGSLQIQATNGDGVLQLDAGGALNLSAGTAAADRLKVNGGSYIQTGGTASFTNVNYSSGTMSVSGGTLSTGTNNTQLMISSVPGSGVAAPVLTVTGTGHVSAQVGAYIGSDGGSGSMNVIGPDARFDALLGLGVGESRNTDGTVASNGSLSIAQGARVTSAGVISVGQYGGVGQVTVDGTGSSLVANAMSIGFLADFHPTTGFAPSVASFAVTNGGTALTQALINVGSRGGNGTLAVSGVGSALTIGDSLYVGTNHYQQPTFDVAAGNGTATVSAGGLLRANGVAVGYAGGNGTMLVTGSNSTLSAANGWITVGQFHESFQNIDEGPGNGVLRIEKGATATYSAEFGAGLDGGTGAVYVDGAGSQLYGTNGWSAINVGDGRATVNGSDVGGSHGELHLTNGAQVSSNTGTFAVTLASMIGTNGGTGLVTVDGTGTQLHVPHGMVYVGYNRPAAGGSDGIIQITNGGSMDVGGAFIGAKGGGGTVTVSGDGSLWQSTSDVYVGSDDSGNLGGGHLVVVAGGKVKVTGTLHVAPATGTPIILNTRGVIAATHFDLASALDFADGTIQGQVTDSGTINVEATGSHTIIGDLTLTGGQVAFDLSALASGPAGGTPAVTAVNPLLYVAGTLDLTGSGDALVVTGGQPGQTYSLFGVGGDVLGAFDSVTPGYQVNTSDGQFSITVAPTPEPATLTVFFTGLAALGLRPSRRRRRARPIN